MSQDSRKLDEALKSLSAGKLCNGLDSTSCATAVTTELSLDEMMSRPVAIDWCRCGELIGTRVILLEARTGQIVVRAPRS